MNTPTPFTILIIGGGFAGVRTALNLARSSAPGVQIRLISNRKDFEYYPTLYRVATGSPAKTAAIPLKTIFKDVSVDLVHDTIISVDAFTKVAVGAKHEEYRYDQLVLAMGSETSYFHIPGLPELSYGFKSVEEAMKLRKHLDAALTPGKEQLPEEKVVAAHFMIVGGGASGTELAGELGMYAQKLAKKHKFDPSFITIDLIEAAPRLLPALPADVSAKVKQHLNGLGVNVFLDRTVIKEEVEELLMKDMTVKTKTVIWTAGVKTNFLFGQIAGLELDKRGRVVVDEYLQAKGVPDLMVVGDGASTQYAGMAQTADHDGIYAAYMLARKAAGQPYLPYVAKKPAFAIPAGPGWAAVMLGETRIYGWPAWALRQAADLRFFASIIPLTEAIKMMAA